MAAGQSPNALTNIANALSMGADMFLKDDKEKHISYSQKLYDDMFKLMIASKDKDINIIFNRSHLGESVYSPLYREYSGDYVFDIEKRYVKQLREELYLMMVYLFMAMKKK